MSDLADVIAEGLSNLPEGAEPSDEAMAKHLADYLAEVGVVPTVQPKKQKLSRKVLKAKIRNLQRGTFRLKVTVVVASTAIGCKEKYTSMVLSPNGDNHLFQWPDGISVKVSLVP